MRFCLIISLLLICVKSATLAQTGYGLQQEYGFVWAHRSGLRHLSNAHLVKTQVDVMPAWLQPQGVKSLYPHATTGFSVGFIDYQNPILGYVIPVTGFFENKVAGRKLSFSYRIAAGFGWCSRKFELETNTANTAISSTINMAAQGTMAANYQFSPTWKARLGVSLQHFSNGSIRQPNAGVNLPTAIAAIFWQPVSTLPQPKETWNVNKGWLFQIGTGVGFKRVAFLPDNIYPLYFLHTWAGYKQSMKSTWWMGADMVVNESLDYFRDNMPEYLNRSNSQFALVGGHEWHVGKVSLLTQLGYTVTNVFSIVDEPLFQRYGIRFQVLKNMQAGLLLKAYRGRADSFEWHAAYSFR